MITRCGMPVFIVDSVKSKSFEVESQPTEAIHRFVVDSL
jgi:hypothetical protein